jgi:hypothetical protein
MADNNLTYTLNLAGNLWSKLKQINIANDEQLDKWSAVQKQVNSANLTYDKMGKSIGSMNQRVAALRAQKEWIPAGNREAIRATNHEIEKLEKEIEKLNALDGGKIKGWFDELKSSVPGLSALTNPLVAIGFAAYKTGEFISGSKQAYMEENIEVAKLERVMKNTMGARQDEINSVLDLASAQQKLGVIGDEVQISGAQELSTYLEKSESLKKLIPSMNDMLAQQYGLNATQEQAVTIAQMMGKVLDGQVGALSRYGYRFDEAQEKVLKFGTEEEKVAMLSNILQKYVGGVNEALAATPEGKLQQQANNIGDLQERVGKLVVQVEAAFSPVIAKVGDLMDKVVSFFEGNREKIMQVVDVLSNLVTRSLDVLWDAIKFVWEMFTGFIDGLRNGNIVFIAVAGAIAGITVALILYNTWIKIVTVATALWNAVLWLTSSPVMLIIAAVAALIAIIGWLCYKIEGWGSLWDGVVGYMKNIFLAYVESVKLYWVSLVNGIMIGLDKIMLGWYKFKAAVGMGDSSENQSAIARINADVEARQQAIVDGVKKVAGYVASANKSFTGIEMGWNSEKSLSDVFGGVKTKLGFGSNEKLQGAVSGPGDSVTNRESGAGSASNSATATGGSRSTNITISIKDVIGQLHMNGAIKENVQEIERSMAEAFCRILGMAETSTSS